MEGWLRVQKASGTSGTCCWDDGGAGGTCPHLENRPEGAWLRKTGVGVAVNGAGDRGQHLGGRLKVVSRALHPSTGAAEGTGGLLRARGAASLR